MSNYGNEITKQLTNARNFLDTEEGKNTELLNFIDGILKDENKVVHCYGRNVKVYIFCKLMDWFIAKDFLKDRKGEDRVWIARDLATKICLDIGGKR